MGFDLHRQIYNPILPLDEYVPDGEPHVFGDRVYLYGSHDKENGPSFCMLDYVGWSAPVNDLTDWRCSGVIYSASQDPRYSEDGCAYLYAPDVVRGNDGRYYLYYCLAGWRGIGGYSNPIGIAVCDTPDGHYEYYGEVSNPDGSPMMKYVNFDPAVINDNGIIRLYSGTWYAFENERTPETNPAIDEKVAAMMGRTPAQVAALREAGDCIMGAVTMTLGEDMRTVIDEPRHILPFVTTGTDFEAHPFFEASSIRKVGDKYYFIYSSVQNHELCYAVSVYPDRDFRFGGTIVSNGDVGYQGRAEEDRLNRTGTTHGSIEKIGGQWYVFYHRLTHQSDYSRQACAEKITILPDGSIPQVEITSCGLNNGPLAAAGTYPAAICCNLTNGHMHHGCNSNQLFDEPMVTDDGVDRYVTGIRAGTVIGYKYFAFSGTCRLNLTVRGKGEGELEVANSLEGPVLTTFPLTAAEKWQNVRAEVPFGVGEGALYLRCTGGDWELLRFSFIED